MATFFAAANLPISEGYGLTETSAGNFVNPPSGLRIGTVGLAMGDLECRIDTDGEILVRGRPVMRGYHNLPGETAAAFTEDGFFRTGDIGTLDEQGYLRITDRKKDLVKTSGGKYIAPSHIEGCSRPSVRTRRRRSSSVRPATSARCWSPWIRTRSGAGRRRPAGGPQLHRDRRLAGGADDGRGVRGPAQRQAQPLGDDQEGRHPAS
ncbi:AMP-binding protein [Micromonospora sp. M12]